MLTCCIFLTFAADADDAVFTSAIRPLLAAKCLNCHNVDRAEGSLRLDSRAAILKGGARGPAVSLETPEKSLLLQAVHRADRKLQMPPKEKLSAVEVAALEKWIRGGMHWPTEKVVAAASETTERLGDAWSDHRNPIVKLFRGRRLDLWSFRPVKAWTSPRVDQADERNSIDAFIAAQRRALGNEEVPNASRRVQLRRLSYDLTGLPPSTDDVEAFERDDAPDAYERVVDQLLASPRYGEHWGRHWLDVVRYSDSNGFDWDEFRPQVWRFRDYVIRSFNEDKPLDRLILEHLAGDELLAGPPRDRREQDALIATGFLRLGPQDNSAGLFNEQPRARAELLSDLVETTGTAILGLSFSCCRCHDHKHDPLSQADYYRFRAFFEGVKFGDGVSIELADEQAQTRKQHESLDRQIAAVQSKLLALTAKPREELRRKKIEKLSPDERRLVETPAKKVAKADEKQRKKLLKQVEPDVKEIAAALPEPQRSEFARLEQEVGQLQKSKKPATTGLLMIEEGAPTPTHVLAGGDYKTPKQAVGPGVPSAFDPNECRPEKCANNKSSGRRTALARWITSSSNPLTARVFVNRVWQAFFGRGLVATPDDFGYAGAKPDDAELLDWLAAEFMRQGWSVKRLQRLVVTSALYRERGVSGGGGDGSIVYGRRLRRLTAEQLRDSMLAVSGLVSSKAGGPPAWPELPAEVLQANPAFLDDNETKTKGWYPSPLDEQYCRSVFLVQKRTVRVPFMETFDLPENMLCCGRRNVSTVAPQALSLMNSPLTEAVAVAFAERVKREVGDDPDHQVRRAFLLAFQRAPTAAEQSMGRKFLMGRRLPDLCRALVNTNEFIYLD